MNRIEHYATYLKGGAGEAAQRIFDGIRMEMEDAQRNFHSNRNPLLGVPWTMELLCREDQELTREQARHFVPSKTFLDRTWTRKWNRKSFVQASKHYLAHLENRPPEHEVFSPARLYEPTAKANARSVDLIHLHWIAYLIDYPTFFRSIPANVPIVWTLHDMHPFTGGCHYSAGCDKFKTGCGNCFQLDNPHPEDLSAIALSQKQRAFRNRSLTIVAPGQWLTELAKQSPVFPDRTRFETIHYGLDTESYRPFDQRKAKSLLGLQADKVTLLFGAADFTIPRKGVEPLIKALRRLPDPERYECVIFGGGDGSQTSLQELASRMSVQEIGFLKTAEEKRIAYSAADMFLLPSLEDNQPQTGLESLACETPVVAFDAGGISEFVIHGKTGLLAAVNDEESLAKQIRWLAQSPETQLSFGQNGRELVLREFEIKQQTRKYLDLYQQLLERQGKSNRRAG